MYALKDRLIQVIKLSLTHLNFSLHTKIVVVKKIVFRGFKKNLTVAI